MDVEDLDLKRMPIKVCDKREKREISELIPILVPRPVAIWSKQVMKFTEEEDRAREVIVGQAQFEGAGVAFEEDEWPLLLAIDGKKTYEEIVTLFPGSEEKIRTMESNGILGWLMDGMIHTHLIYEPVKSVQPLKEERFYEDVVRLSPADRLEAPTSVQLTVTMKCHSNCRFCFEAVGAMWNRGVHREIERNKMELEEYKELIRSFDKAGLRSLSLSGGEPTMEKELLLELTAYALERRIDCSIVTNGYEFADRSFAEDYFGLRKKHGYDNEIQQISCESSDPKLQRYLRPGVPLSKILDSIQNLKELGERPYICTIMNKLNFGEKEHLVEWSKDLGCCMWRTEDVRPVGEAAYHLKELLLTPRQIYDLYAFILKEKIKYQGADFYERDGGSNMPYGIAFTVNDYRPPPYMDPYEKPREGKRDPWGCTAARRALTILPNGNTVPCGYVLAYPSQWGENVREKDWKEIWKKDPVLNSWRHVHEMKGKCARCEYQNHCERACPAKSFAITGDPWVSEPFCFHQPGRKESRDDFPDYDFVNTPEDIGVERDGFVDPFSDEFLKRNRELLQDWRSQ